MASEEFAVVSYYAFVTLSDPHAEVEAQRGYLSGVQALGRIYLSEQGINAQLSLPKEQLAPYQEWVYERRCYGEPLFKVQYWHEQAFPRLAIRYRKQLVALDKPVDLSLTGDYLTPQQWRQKLDEKEASDFLLLDVRNQYEWDVGHFEGSFVPPCATFREFNGFAEELAQKEDKDREVLMCCTGGIRCELYSALLKEKGFTNVRQLQGGIINYGRQEGSRHWQGKLFVFDDRLTVPISEEPTDVVGSCHYCKRAIEAYYNCANMDCNELFLCCRECLVEQKGCCCHKCVMAPRVRPYHEQQPHKPFRRISSCSL